MKETDLYEPVKAKLEEIGYEVFPEVEVGSKRADVVGRLGPATSVIEMKTSFNLKVLDQAFHWTKHAHYVWVAVPLAYRRRVPKIVYQFMRDHKIGVMEVNPYFPHPVRITVPARYNRPTLPIDWDNYATPLHQTWDLEAGSAGGGHLTPYKSTIHYVRNYLSKQEGWTSLNEILEHCETHWRSPRNSLAKSLRDFEVDWCESKVINRRLHYRLKKGVT